MGQALYRKYRPKSLTDVAGQEHITTTLANAIKSGRISHAYLLTGPRGVGKTSIARILAHELNGLTNDQDAMQLDIIEIDAASNRRIDEIRDLRDKVHILPTSSKYKVYIIDEVHMLTREAFNALLKTLEEPPEHVIFILATTEAHKLPETIISRTQHFAFKPIEIPTLVERLRAIAGTEKMAIDDAALELIAIHGDGSFRDSISLLDQARGLSDATTKAISEADVERLLGVAPAPAIDALLVATNQGTPKDILDLLIELRGQGLQSSKLAGQLSERLRSAMLDDPAHQNQATTRLLHALLGVGASSQADRLLELVLLDHRFSLQPSLSATVPTSAKASAAVSPSPASTTVKDKPSEPEIKQRPKQPKPAESESTPGPTDAKKPTSKAADKSEEPAETATSKDDESAEPADLAFSTEAWPVVLATIKKKYNTLYGILRMSEPSVNGNTLTLSCTFGFHQKQINEGKNRKIISDIIKDKTGQDIEIVCVVAEKRNGPAPTQKNSAKTISNVSDIFGGAEVLES